MNRRCVVSLMAGVLAALTLPAPLGAADPTAPTTRQMKLITWTEFREWGEMRGYPIRVGTTDAAKSEEDAAHLWQVSAELTGAR